MPQETYKVTLADGRSFNVTTTGGAPTEEQVLASLGDAPAPKPDSQPGLMSQIGDAALQGVLGPGKALWNIPKAIYQGVKEDPVAALPDIGGAVGGMAGPAGAAAGGAAGKLAEYGTRLGLNSNLDKVPANASDAVMGILKAAAIQGGMQAAPAVVGQIGKATKAVGRNLLGRAVAPNLSELGHMAESTRMLPADIRGQIADTLHGWNIPVNPGGTLKLRGIVNDINQSVRGLVKSAGERGESADAGKMLKETADYVLKHPIEGHTIPAIAEDITPSEAINAARAKLRKIATDPESKLTVPYRQWTQMTERTEPLANEIGLQTVRGKPLASAIKTDMVRAGPQNEMVRPTTVRDGVSLDGITFKTTKGETSLEGVQFPWRRRGTTIPNPEVDPETLLDVSQGVYRKHRGDYGLKGSEAVDATVDKSWNHVAGTELERMAPGVADLRSQEHQALNALEPMFRRTYNQSNQRPVSLYQFLAATTADPVMGALSIGLTPQMMGAVGHGGMKLGTDLMKVNKSPQMWANLFRTALLSQMGGSQNPE